ncbi:adenosylmethionine--8-amino-7-oxononanoate transaminase [Catenulispora pinisilvae]|uniref:adenosylmethionine--8-amino-7-oxononanoate transaminase n=1 Tax=Catenulispora pinisilvae TaxID=2705253 RepID=UPI0018920C60|nr:adenosylmethionine--8-amino-7-oxononanoate transaminase [Catenulispora pinisilvae]
MSDVNKWTPELASADRDTVWHPYAPMPSTVEPFPVVGADGVRIRLADGRELIDGMASWWSAIHGYRHPVLDQAARDQLDSMAHVMFGGLTHAPAVRLAERLTALAPAGLAHVFFADSGSVSVEVAIKMCLQYQRSQGHAARTRLMTVRGGYHGDTFGAMAVTDPAGSMHQLWADVLPRHVFADRPPATLTEEYAAHLADLAARHADTLAAIIVEPVVQGAGGMHFYDPEVLKVLRAICDEHGLLLVFDEIATGFGRTGELFAADHAGLAPDIMTVGKAMTGGYLTMAAVLCTTGVAHGISSGEAPVLMHGPTFMANPLACAVAYASTGLLLDGTWRAQVAGIEKLLTAHLEPARELPGVADVRVLGAIGVIEMEQPTDMRTATKAAMDEGVWIRPFGKLLYVMPPYVTPEEDVERIAAALVAAARASGAGSAA